MKKVLFEFFKTLGFVFVYYLGDVICRWLTGKDEFPKYYWICAGLSLVYQIVRDIDEIKNKMENKNEKHHEKNL